MTVYTYVITRDYGFCTKSFFGCCTLATCKPKIRNSAQIGDWIVGFGSNAVDSCYKNRIIYAFEVEGKLTFDNYWNSSMFQNKKPLLTGSLKQCYGDNIYHKVNGLYRQENSHHSFEEGIENLDNKTRDLHSEYVLYGHKYFYWGKDAIPCKKQFLLFKPSCRDHRRFSSSEYPDVILFIDWICSNGAFGFYSEPIMFNAEFERYKGERI